MKMKNKLSVIIGAIIVLLITSCATGLLYRVSKIKQVNDATVKIKSIFGQGSGVILERISYKELTVLTNKHVCEIMLPMGGALTVHGNYKVTIKRMSTKYDLCLMNMELTPDSLLKVFETVKVASSDVETGDYVFNVGFPMGIKRIFDGYVSPNKRFKKFGDVEYKGISVTIYGGASGSGVYNYRGELVGLAAIAYKGKPGLSYMVPLEHIKEFLKEK